MKITQVSYKTNKPSRNNQYVHEHIELVAVLEPNETPEQAIDRLRLKAKALLDPVMAKLRPMLEKMLPAHLYSRYIKPITDEHLSELYNDTPEVFTNFINGEDTNREFLKNLRSLQENMIIDQEAGSELDEEFPE